MPTFRCEVMGGGGGAATAGGIAAQTVVDAPDRATAVRLLRERGVTPLKLEEVSGSAKAAAKRAAVSAEGVASGNGARTPFSAGMSRAGMATFIRELATAVQAGLPLVTAMRTIARQGHTAYEKTMIMHLVHTVEGGRSLADAAVSWGKPFNELSVNLLRAGEASGRLGEVLEQAADLLDKDVKMRRSLLAATMYPMILMGLVAVAVGIVVGVIVPKILAPLKGQLPPDKLAFPTRVVQAAADFVQHQWWLIALVAIGVPLLFARAYAQPGPRMTIDTVLLKIPFLGRMLRDVGVARFTRTLGTLVSAGLPALTALRLVKPTLGNKVMEEAIDHVCAEVSAGKTISEPLEATGQFPPLLVQIVSVGERSGRLPQMLRQAATALEDRTEMSIKLFTTALPPVLVVIAAGIIGFVVAAIILPLLQMQEAIG